MIAIAAIKRLMLATLLIFAAIGLAATYWALTGRDGILLREDNARLIEAVARIQRGSIYDRQEQLLVESLASSSGITRSYLRPSSYSLVGYYSLRYGAAGIEAAFNQTLSGSKPSETLADYFLYEIVNLPQQGADLRLTLLADVQDALTLAMGDNHGAAIVMDAKSGAILAMVSLPAYDPNTLDADWETLIADEGRPFFNRAVQGRYQPGSAMTILWLAQAIESGFDLSTAFTEPNAPVELEPDMRFQCMFQPPSAAITLTEAFIAGCPAPFVDYHALLADESYARIVATFSLDAPSTLAGFPLAGASVAAAADRGDAAESDTTRLRDVLGQGNLTITPLHMAAIMSAVAHDGAAPKPHVLSEVRQPGAETWQEKQPVQSADRMLTADSAARLRAVFQESWRRLQAESASPDHRVGARIAMSRSGEDTQIWLNGFVTPDERPAVALVAVLENTDDIEALLALAEKTAQAILSL